MSMRGTEVARNKVCTGAHVHTPQNPGESLSLLGPPDVLIQAGPWCSHPSQTLTAILWGQALQDVAWKSLSAGIWMMKTGRSLIIYRPQELHLAVEAEVRVHHVRPLLPPLSHLPTSPSSAKPHTDLPSCHLLDLQRSHSLHSHCGWGPTEKKLCRKGGLRSKDTSSMLRAPMPLLAVCFK